MTVLTKEQERELLKFYPDLILNPEETEIASDRYACLEVFGFCGCGDPEGVRAYLRDMMSHLDIQQDSSFYKGATRDAMKAGGCEPDSAAGFLLMYWMDEKGWIEHGSNVRGSWLTAKGKAVLNLLNLECEL